MSKYLMILCFFATLPAWGQSWSSLNNNIQTERVLSGKSINGQERIPIRQLVERRLAQKGQSLRSYQLEGVTLYAKSWGSQNTATMRVGRDRQTQTVRRARNFAFFIINEPFTYHKLTWDLRNGAGQSDEVWQMIFNGQIEVRSLDVHLSKAQNIVTIPMGNQIFSQDTNINIKRELRRLGVPVGPNTTIKSLVFFAKSARGNGMAQLRVGNQVLNRQNVFEARPGFTFRDTNQRSYNRIPWRINNQRRGEWFLQMRGRIRIHSIVVELN